VGGFYSGQGVTFSNADFSTFGSLPGGTPPIAITSGVGTFFQFPDRIVAVFNAPVDLASIDVLDLGGNGFRVDAYDAAVGGALVDVDQQFGVGAGVGNFATLSVSGASIFRLEFYQVLNTFGDGVALDNFQFQLAAVPEPASMLAWGLLTGVGLVGYRLRRRKVTA
jgi:hypothetical protein